MLVSQIDRLEASIDRYQRLRDVQPTLARIQVNDLVQNLVALRGVNSGSHIIVKSHLLAISPSATPIGIW